MKAQELEGSAWSVDYRERAQTLPVILPDMLPNLDADGSDTSVDGEDENAELERDEARGLDSPLPFIRTESDPPCIPRGPAFPPHFGFPYQLARAPRTPQSRKRHEDIGALLIRLASKKRPAPQGESARGAAGQLPIDPLAGSPSATLSALPPAPLASTPSAPSSLTRSNSLPSLKLLDLGSASIESIEESTQKTVAGDAEAESYSSPSRPLARLSQEDTVIIFDWDDTLFPTWYISEVIIPCLPPGVSEDSCLQPDSPFRETMVNGHRHSVHAAMGVCSAARYLPSIDLEAFLTELQIPIMYARECIRKPFVSMAQVEEGVNVLTIAKQAAMQKALKKLYGKREWKNVISIGDSIVERDAITEVLWSHGAHLANPPCCKTVKLMEEPSVEQLGAELTLLGMWLRSMASFNGDFDVNMDDS
eukprot:CAMPEP_0180834944 /NCGR_PEP_ID=MMETSP1038_2-20121128/78118_1 /TAXON_ID=632150 /ORGANISM="Azadinium spinosum, Strain 3D9" /LENGTH=420 /DNA_ID=CAMNT_0022878195 /DNA_START=232 /DNA_END=1492 /DNA_ORIENTATION=+